MNSINSDRKVSPDELTEGFRRVGLSEGDALMMHASLGSFGAVDGGAAMVLHRLLGVLGKEGALMMPAFTYITTHSNSHGNNTEPGCWCEGREDRHIPFIPELQPDKAIGEIAHRLCSWPASRRSRHPSFSFIAVGKNGDELVRDHPLTDPLSPIKKMLKFKPFVLMIGVDFDTVTAIHLAEERKIPDKFEKERALTISSKGQSWVEVIGMGCSNGFTKINSVLSQTDFRETKIGLANVRLYKMESLIERAGNMLSKDPAALACGNSGCLSCVRASKKT